MDSSHRYAWAVVGEGLAGSRGKYLSTYKHHAAESRLARVCCLLYYWCERTTARRPVVLTRLQIGNVAVGYPHRSSDHWVVVYRSRWVDELRLVRRRRWIRQ